MLMLPTPNMSVTQHNLPATPAQAAIGTSVPAHASANTKSSWVEVFSSTNFDVNMICVTLINDSVAGSFRNNLYDIGVGASSSEQVIIANMMSTSSADMRSSVTPNQLYFPIYIPKGTRIAARHQSSTGSTAGRVLIFLFGGSSGVSQLFSGAEAIGVDTSTSKGTPITSGDTGTESAWTSIGSTTSREYRAILPMAGQDTDIAMSSLTYHMEWGYSSTTLGERLFVGNNTELVGSMIPCLPDYMTIPSGTQLEMRIEGSGASADSMQYGLMGFY